MMVFMILHVDDILLIGNDVGLLSIVKIWLSTQFQIRGLGGAQYILYIKVLRNYKNGKFVLSQATYINKLLVKYEMQNSKKNFLPFKHEVLFSQDQCPKTLKGKECIHEIPYALVVSKIMYTILYTIPDIYISIGMVSRYQSNSVLKHWATIKYILKYLRRIGVYMLVFHGDKIVPIGYIDSHVRSNKDSCRSIYRWCGYQLEE